MCLTRKGAEKRSDDMNDDTVPDVGMTLGLDEAMPPSTRRRSYARLIASALTAAAAFVAPAYVVSRNPDYPWVYTEQRDGTIILGGDGMKAIMTDIGENVAIPSSIDGKTVTVIGRHAFMNFKTVKSVSIPDSVRKIEEGAFRGCSVLASVTLPENLPDIEGNPFYACPNLADEQGFVIFDDVLFGYHGTDTVVCVPLCVKRLSPSAFYDKSDLEHITVPEGVTNIGKSAFAYCSNLKGVSLPSSVLHMGEDSFNRCSLLESISLPDRMTELADGLFSVCSSLKSIKYPADLQRIGSYAFADCLSLDKVEIPFGVVNVDDSAFAGCKSLSSVVIPSTVTSIGDGAFERCPALASVRFIGEAPAMGSYPFGSIPSNGRVTLPVELESWSGVGERWNYMTVVAANAVDGPYRQTVDGVTWTFSISNGLVKVGSGVFGSPSISRSVAGDIAIPARLGNCKVSTIGEWAFRYCDKLTSVSIPEGVTGIETSAFEGCSSLKTASFPSSLTVLGDYSFYNCSALDRVMFKGEDLLLGDYAFCGCTSLESIAFAGSEPDVGQFVFHSCPATAKVFIPSSASGWAAPGNAWNGMKLYHAEMDTEVVYVNSLPEFAVISPETSVKITPKARAQFTAADAEDAASRIQYLPVDIDQEVRFFKGIGTVNPSGEIVITTQLDLEAMEFAETSKEVCEKLSSAKGDAPTITLPSAKPGFWYGVAVADNLADLQTAGVADAARASVNGVSLTIPKPEGGTAFFKVMVNTQEIPVR